MAARNLFLGIKAFQAIAVVGTIVDSTVDSVSWDSAYTDASVLINRDTSIQIAFTDDAGAAVSTASGEVLEVRWDDFISTTSSNIPSLLVFQNASDQSLFRFTYTASGTLYSLQYNSGTLASPVWTNVTGSPTYSTAAFYVRATHNLKLHINGGGVGNHTVEYYRDGTLVASGSFTMALLTVVSRVTFGGALGNVARRISEVFVATDKNLIGSRVPSIKASGAGASSGMTGVFTNVNKIIGSDATAVSSATATQRTTFAMSNLPALPIGTIIDGGSRHSFRARASAVAPSNLRSVIRQAGVDTLTGNIAGIAVGYLPFAIGYTMTEAQIDAVELGWESAT